MILHYSFHAQNKYRLERSIIYASTVCHREDRRVQDIPKVCGDIHHKKTAMALTNNTMIAPSREMTFILKAALSTDVESDGMTEGCGMVFVSGIIVAGGLGGGRGLGRAIIVVAEINQVIRSSETEAKLLAANVSFEVVKVSSRSAVVESPVESIEGPLEAMDSGAPSPDAGIFAFEFEPASNLLEEPGLRPALDLVSGEAGDSFSKETVSGSISGPLSKSS